MISHCLAQLLSAYERYFYVFVSRLTAVVKLINTFFICFCFISRLSMTDDNDLLIRYFAGRKKHLVRSSSTSLHTGWCTNSGHISLSLYLSTHQINSIQFNLTSIRNVFGRRRKKKIQQFLWKITSHRKKIKSTKQFKCHGNSLSILRTLNLLTMNFIVYNFVQKKTTQQKHKLKCLKSKILNHG